MQKLIINLILLLSILSLTSCSTGGSRTTLLNRDNDDKIAEKRLKEVLDALEHQDKDAMKAIFSKDALENAEEFDSNMNNLFNYFKGGVDSWEESDGPTVYESNDYGHKTKEISSYYYVISHNNKYFFLLQDYPINTDNPNNVGLHMLLVVKAEDETNIWDGDKKILYDGDNKISHAGIYIPIK